MVSKKISNELELVKWLAILGIFTFHFSDTIVSYNIYQLHNLVEKIFHVGSQGIHIFFILSAFFIYLKYGDTKQDFNVLARIKKLYPQYLISIVFVLFLYFLFSKTFTIDEIIVNILPIIRNLSQEYIRTINGNWWFLHTLIEFYIVFYFIRSKLLNIKSSLLIISTILIYIFYVSVYTFLLDIDSRNLTPYSSFFINYIYDFTIGIVAARFYIEHQQNNTNHKYLSKLINNPYLLILIGIFFEFMGLVITKVFNIFGYNINDIFFAIGISAIYLGLVKFISNLKQNITILLINNTAIIYIIYLIHHPIIINFTSIIPQNNIFSVLLMFFVSLVTTFIISLIFIKILKSMKNENE